ncbi:unnamed protein product [Vitrella brassicaformis CCMP3155]|uniref:Uncharacterized protein n=1 Tax=Vitrella brassicaformis (strain CCMP3155) TaxID=1169540 RepID=A0A0G4E8Q4_VITBC|nr:unnamed protein product [Vitrella brassicaformis CCMP3155]|eukprot:CEL92251.1 unnamed protein product [Vitrella brassicaformis CCMP3155]
MSVSGRELSRSRVKRRLDEDPSSWQGCRGDGEERRVARCRPTSHRSGRAVGGRDTLTKTAAEGRGGERQSQHMTDGTASTLPPTLASGSDHNVAPAATKTNSLQLPPTDNDGPTMPMPLVEIKTELDPSRPTRIINKLNKHTHNTDVQQQDPLHQHQQSVQGCGSGDTPGSWLFSVGPGVGDEQVRQILGFSVDVTRTIDAAGWTCEKDMWRSVVQIGSPALLGFFDAVNYEDSSSARDLVRTAVDRLVRRETLLLVVDHVPGKDEALSAVDNAETVKLVAILIDSILEAWQLQKRVNPGLLARTAVVLRGRGVGRKMRAGVHRVRIQPLEASQSS